jgi:hypothetical protein
LWQGLNAAVGLLPMPPYQQHVQALNVLPVAMLAVPWAPCSHADPQPSCSPLSRLHLCAACPVFQVFGENMAILSGDALLVYAFEHIARDTKGVSAERIVKVIVELGRASGADGLVGGQVVDIQSEDKEVSG